MNFKPILFSTPMVQAILNGTKVQTRRVVKPQPIRNDLPIIPIDGWGFGQQIQIMKEPPRHEVQESWKCPYGEVGDVLWVRESFYQYGFWRKNGLTKTGKQKWKFIADNAYTSIAYNDNPPSSIFKNSQRVLGWYKRSSLFMPKEACRLFLKIKDIRVERLQDISEEDAISEGVLKDVKLPVENFQTRLLYRDYKGDTSGCADARSSFMTLWKSINGEQSWNENPWVWVIEFERIEKPENF